MVKRPKTFPPLHSAMVRAGERAGFLEDALTNISEFLERQDELRSKIRGALIYPLVLVSLGAVVVLGILLFLVPVFQPVFEGIPLPTPSRILFAMSAALRLHWAASAAVLAAAGGGFVYFIKSSAGRRLWDAWKLRIPIYGRVGRTIMVTRFCRVLGTMLHNGVPILQALAISKGAADNVLLEASIERASENVRAGEPLAGALRESRLFPEEILEMIAVAEESNQLEKVLVNVADTIERRMNRQVDAAVRLIEPLILVVIAGVIAFVAFGLIYPIFTLARTLNK
jgi:general secretion pathway protein F/type IV pilus assembly protein PilC